jgi:hypothetical protein
VIKRALWLIKLSIGRKVWLVEGVEEKGRVAKKGKEG